MKIIKNYFYNMSYNILILLTPLLTVPYVARVLGPVGVGINASTNSIVTYFLLAGTIGITTYGNREIAFCSTNREKRSKIFWEIEFLQIITILIAYIAFLVFLYFETQFKIFFFFQSFLIVAGAFDISWYFMGLEDFRKTVGRNMIIKLVSLLCIFVFVKSSQDTGKYILILSLSQLLGNVTLWPYLRKSVMFLSLRKLNVFRHFKPSVELFIPQIAIQIYLALNKTMLWRLDSVEASGFFDYSDKLIKIVLAVVTATGTVMLPRIANLFAQKKLDQVYRYLYVSFDFVSSVAFAMAFGIAAVATSLAPWFFGRHFGSVGSLLMIEAPVIVLIGWSNVLGQQYLLPTKQTKKYTQSVTVGALVNIILNIPMILVFGVKGAMICTLLSEMTVTIFQIIATRKQLNLLRLFGDTWKYLVAGIVMFIPVFMLNIVMKITVVSLVEQIIEGILIYVGMICLLQASIIQELSKFIGKRKLRHRML